MLHVFRFDPDAVYVPPGGNRLGDRYRLGDWQCVMCRASFGFCDPDGGDDCPGLTRPATDWLTDEEDELAAPFPSRVMMTRSGWTCTCARHERDGKCRHLVPYSPKQDVNVSEEYL